MKIKTYKLFTEGSKGEIELAIDKLINWDLVNDLREMSLEYLDRNMQLSLTISAISTWSESNGYGVFDDTMRVLLYILDYSHYSDETIYDCNGDLTEDGYGDINSLSTLTYDITMIDIKSEETNEEATYDLIERLKELYPDEHIRYLLGR